MGVCDVIIMGCGTNVMAWGTRLALSNVSENSSGLVCNSNALQIYSLANGRCCLSMQ